MTHTKNGHWNVCGMCIKTLGMLSWSMASIQDHRPSLKTTRTATSPETSKHLLKNDQQVCLDIKHATQGWCQHLWPQHAPDKASVDLTATSKCAMGQCQYTSAAFLQHGILWHG